MRLFAALLPFLLVMGRLSAQEDLIEILLSNGDVHDGMLIEETDRELTIRQAMRSKSGIVSANVQYQRSELKEIINLTKEYRERAIRAGSSIESQVALAGWCGTHGLHDEAATHALVVIAEIPSHMEMRALLWRVGYVEINGRWKKEDDYLAEHGLERFLDRVYTRDNKEKLKELVAKRSAAEREFTQQSDALARLQALLSLDQKYVADDKIKQSNLDALIKDDAAKLTASQKALVDARKSLDSANKAVNAASGRRGRRSLGPSKAMLDARSQAEAMVTDLQQRVDELQSQSDQDIKKKVDLAAREKRLSAELEKYSAQSTAVAGVVATARGTAEKVKVESEAAMSKIMPVNLPYEQYTPSRDIAMDKAVLVH